MNIQVHVKVAGALLLALGFEYTLFGHYFKWKKELAQLSLLTRQIFLVHCFFISLMVVLIGACSLFYTTALLGSGTLSRVVLAGFVLFWSIRLACQFFVYDSAIWRGRPFYTVMHVAFSIFWSYVVLTYGAALRGLEYVVRMRLSLAPRGLIQPGVPVWAKSSSLGTLESRTRAAPRTQATPQPPR
jgi:hypothetical protein